MSSITRWDGPAGLGGKAKEKVKWHTKTGIETTQNQYLWEKKKNQKPNESWKEFG